MAAGARVRALATGPVFWVAMLAASALGTNLGDFAARGLGLTKEAGFAVLVAVCGASVLADRQFGRRTEAFYWVAIVLLRAAATNVADALTHPAGLGFVPVTAVLGVLALAAGARTRAAPDQPGSPLVDAWYWTAMFIAGVVGTTGGDLAWDTAGLPAATAALTALLVLLLAVRARWFPRVMLAYWCVVLAERCAGTPIGDGLAFRHGLDLGLPVSIACTGAVFGAALLWRERQRHGVATAAA